MEESIHFKGLLKIVTGKRKVEKNCKVENHWVIYLLANFCYYSPRGCKGDLS